MRWLYNALQGTLRVAVSGAEPELFLNRCASNGVPIWAVDRPEAFSLLLTMPLRYWKKAKTLAGPCQCQVEVIGRWGLPLFLLRFRKRYALLAGGLLCLLAVTCLSQMIFVIDIQGNVAVTEGEILSALRQYGVRPGVYGSTVDRYALRDQMLLAIDELSFFSISLRGTRAQVIVREVLPKPDLREETALAHVVAKSDGIITHMEVTGGQARCQKGDSVEAGQLLISGVVDIQEAEYSNADLGTALHRAEGRVIALTWHTLTAKLPLTAQIKDYDGAEMTRYALNILGRRLKIYGNGGISFDKYDKITSTISLQRSDGTPLPFSLEREQLRSYTTCPAQLDEDATAEMLRNTLSRRLSERLGEDGQVLQEDYVLRREGDWLEMTLLAECRESIGKTVPFDPVEEGILGETLPEISGKE